MAMPVLAHKTLWPLHLDRNVRIVPRRQLLNQGVQQLIWCPWFFHFYASLTFQYAALFAPHSLAAARQGPGTPASLSLVCVPYPVALAPTWPRNRACTPRCGYRPGYHPPAPCVASSEPYRSAGSTHSLRPPCLCACRLACLMAAIMPRPLCRHIRNTLQNLIISPAAPCSVSLPWPAHAGCA